MKINWIDTYDIYQRIIAAPDDEARERIYEASFIQPWQQMMAMVAGPAAAADRWAGARNWQWLLPDQLRQPPSLLVEMAAASAWATGAAAMQTAVDRFADYQEQIPIETIEGWLLLADPERADPINRGYTGAGDFMQPRFVVQYSEANDYNLPRLGGCIVHEMHHLIRSRVVPWFFPQATVAQYIVHEGLAESFAAAIYGPDMVGYYVTEFAEGELATARTLLADNLATTGFDLLRSFIFGDHWAKKLGLPEVGMPAYGGYAIGYRVVQAYLQRTGSSIEAATFVPADQIIADSGYFA